MTEYSQECVITPSLPTYFFISIHCHKEALKPHRRQAYRKASAQSKDKTDKKRADCSALLLMLADEEFTIGITDGYIFVDCNAVSIVRIALEDFPGWIGFMQCREESTDYPVDIQWVAYFCTYEIR